MDSTTSPAVVARVGRRQLAPADADEGLIRWAARGDLDAFAVLADRHGPMAYRVALRLLGRPEDAADVAEETMVTAWRQLPGFRAEVSFSTWLYRIVVRRALHRLFRARPAGSFDPLGEAAPPVSVEPE